MFFGYQLCISCYVTNAQRVRFGVRVRTWRSAWHRSLWPFFDWNHFSFDFFMDRASFANARSIAGLPFFWFVTGGGVSRFCRCWGGAHGERFL